MAHITGNPATANGGARQGLSLGAKKLPATNSRNSSNEQAASPPLAVYSGRDCIGFIRQLTTGAFEALDLDRKSLGVFPTRGAAADALEEAMS